MLGRNARCSEEKLASQRIYQDDRGGQVKAQAGMAALALDLGLFTVLYHQAQLSQITCHEGGVTLW